MRFGILLPIQQAELAKGAGFDFVEELVPYFLSPNQDGPVWAGEALAARSALPVLAARDLIPPSLKLVGPDVDMGALRSHIQLVCERAEMSGIRTFVLGSAASRMVPDGFDRKQAKRQILEFVRSAVHFCSRHNVMLVCDSLSRDDCNIINSLPESLQYVWEVDHPNFQCLLNANQLLKEQEPLDNLRDALPWIRYVHISTASSATAEERTIFGELKKANYDGAITMATIDEQATLAELAKSLRLLKAEWEQA